LDTQASPPRWLARWYTQQSYVDKHGVTRYRKGSRFLGLRTKGDLLTKAAAERKWASIRDSVMAPPPADAKDARTTFRQFLEREYVPLKKGGWNDLTRAKLTYYFTYMTDAFGGRPIAEIESRVLAEFLQKLAAKHCQDTVTGVLVYMRNAFEEAVDLGYVERNPARKLKAPVCTREKDDTTVSLDEVAALENALTGRDRTIFRLLARCGPRAGEAFAIKWQDIRPDQTLMIARTYSRARLKKPKTEGSKDTVYLPKSLYDELLSLREQSDDPTPEGWVFPSSRKRKRGLMPLDYHNWIARNLKPVADKLGIRVNAQIMRRSFATLANQVTADLKSIQRQMRHSRASTTADIYTQAIRQEVQDAVEALDREIRSAPGEAK
jgi:integrase